ncbi:hypothetical protein T261_7842 [Streptomyces lydicus]|nr:hypothetical protein T261_7842 [Streptomyces lydicus]
MSPVGRFIEIGKTDIRDSARVCANHPGVVYLPFERSHHRRTWHPRSTAHPHLVSERDVRHLEPFPTLI